MDQTEHPLSRCPYDGAPLARLTMGTGQPTRYEHRDGTWHLDAVGEFTAAVRLDIAADQGE